MRRATAVLLGLVVVGGLLALLSFAVHGNDGEAAQVGAEGVDDTGRWQLERAEHLLRADCMRRLGFHYPATPAGSEDPVPSLPKGTTWPFGIDNIEWAEAHGFGSDLEAANTVAANAARQADPVGQYFATLSEPDRDTFGAALYGTQSDPAVSTTLPNGFVITTRTRGCQAEARTTLYRDQETWLRVSAVTQALPGLAVEAARSDGAFQAAQRAWSQCIAGRGHDAPDMASLRAAFVAGTAGMPAPQRRAEEVRRAVDEAVCAKETRVTAIGERLRQEALRELRRAHRASIDSFGRLQTQAAVRAGQILRSQSPLPPASPHPAQPATVAPVVS